MIKLNNISKTYPSETDNVNVINDLSITFDEKKIVSILGKSGSGKTTLLLITGGLMKADKGEVIINGKSMSSLATFRKENIGFIFQEPHLLNEYTVAENIMLPLLIANKKINDSKKVAYNLLSSMKLEHLSTRYPKQISRGEQQRIALLRSLSNKPKIILADEPTANLDEKNCEQLLEFIVKINKEFNILFIIATHDNKFINISNNSYELNNGKLV